MSQKARKEFKHYKKIVVKVGTSTLMHPNGAINLQRMEKLAFVLSDLKNQGIDVVLVSSGSLGLGLAQMNLTERPATIPEQQAISSIGQTELMSLYGGFFNHYGHQVGQILLTKDVIDFPQSRLNAINTIEQLLTKKIIPIINENDTVSVEELDHLTRFGDNDTLSANVLEMIEADLLIMLTDIDGFYNKNPQKYSDAVKYDTIHSITDDLYKKASTPGSRFGTGGMTTKLKSAEIVLKNDKKMVLVDGSNPSILFDVIDGEIVGTLFSPSKEESI